LQGSRTSILSQYDEEEQTEGFTLQGGVAKTKEAKEAELAAIRRKLSGKLSSTSESTSTSATPETKLQFDLNSDSSFAPEYYTREEMVAFRKPRKERKSGKKRKRVNLAEILGDTASTTVDDMDADHGSRTASATNSRQVSNACMHARARVCACVVVVVAVAKLLSTFYA
jgi:U4/U6.U5 tri-snRNP-associated protein 1